MHLGISHLAQQATHLRTSARAPASHVRSLSPLCQSVLLTLSPHSLPAPLYIHRGASAPPPICSPSSSPAAVLTHHCAPIAASLAHHCAPPSLLCPHHRLTTSSTVRAQYRMLIVASPRLPPHLTNTRPSSPLIHHLSSAPPCTCSHPSSPAAAHMYHRALTVAPPGPSAHAREGRVTRCARESGRSMSARTRVCARCGA
ncbi:hypothetical protein EVG20_g8769 [Dentipellis fragilis]|uniref:Uncharacterized protein n=1 Tax=Dentipellis fragilis TaxID=205917 RepID=A0A4Y9Y307_9AGAM|nr:hypothetical protein EVG20_g8769 [Dentipellis fragilis]